MEQWKTCLSDSGLTVQDFALKTFKTRHIFKAHGTECPFLLLGSPTGIASGGLMTAGWKINVSASGIIRKRRE